MTVNQIITTIFGGALFPFLIRMFWGKLIDTFGAIGGWLAAGFLVGTTWTINHGLNMIYQTGPVWIDMAIAAGTGCLVATTILGGSFKKAIPNITGSVIGAILGGFILSLFL